ncbi:efflux RND transporter periplasmic adaptor subunit [Paracoccus aurantiacus]|uniref:Efflux RND transporter periplasmic adaptor subunit n=1 Tax=Paracoccus aurantiacus TaxID=2599412 RepID=A0A5C6S2B4_9RHOB|nr:efflux RND transporter periplasmic adaptor subunit [Paracoccus aurantiacus]TXB68598.1 efflux RND transporter periplasmic adaptor subunit [Paracoccus aurantiacus]
MSYSPWVVLTAFALTFSTPATLWAQSAPPAGMANQKVSVGTVTLSPEAVPLTLDLSGTAVAAESAQIRPLVQGVVQEILYRPDERLSVGSPMFQIDPTSYDAALAVAKASLSSAEAARDEAQANADRYDALAGRGVTQADADSARSTLLQAQAAVEQAEAEVKAAQFDLDNTTIKSPLEGEASVAEISVGDLVTSGQSDILATVTKLDPIYADLADTSARMLRLRAMFAQGVLKPGASLEVRLILENGEELSGDGKVVSVGDQVSTSTGTFNVRVEIANPDRAVLPGMFVTARLTFGTMQAVLVPQVAASAQADGTIEIFTVEDGKAKAVYVQPTGSTDSAWIVPEGIAQGTILIVDNKDNLRDGADVQPVAVTLGTGGVVSEADATAQAQAGGAETSGTAGTDAAAETESPAPAEPAVANDATSGGADASASDAQAGQ